MKVWENIKFANDTTILDKDWVRPTFTEGRHLWGHHVKKPSVDLASEVTVAITIRKWKMVKKVEEENQNLMEKWTTSSELSVKEKVAHKQFS